MHEQKKNKLLTPRGTAVSREPGRSAWHRTSRSIQFDTQWCKCIALCVHVMYQLGTQWCKCIAIKVPRCSQWFFFLFVPTKRSYGPPPPTKPKTYTLVINNELSCIKVVGIHNGYSAPSFAQAAMQGYYFLKIRVIAPKFRWAHGEGKLL